MRILIALLLAAGLSPAATYYVANAGSDAANGTSTSTPWQTVAHVNAQTFSAGDTILFNRGDKWREQLTVPSAGISGNQITFGSYGSGAQPVITGANLTTWTQGSGVPAVETCTGTCVFNSGLETGGSGLTEWTSHSNTDTTVTQSTVNPAHGSFDLAVGPGVATGNRAIVQKTISALALGNTYYFRFYINIPSGSLLASQSIKPFYLGLNSNGTNTQMTLAANASGNVSSLSWFDTTHSFGISGAAVSNFVMGAWNYIDLAYTVSATTGGVQAWVNGTSIGSVTGKDSSGSVGWNNIITGNNNFASCLAIGSFFYIDDVQVNTAGPIGTFNTGGAFPVTVWRASQATNPLLPNFGGTVGIRETSVSAVTGPNEWYWDGSAFLYVYGATDPTGIVEIPTRSYAILDSGGFGYISLLNLDLRGGKVNGFACGISLGCNGMVFDSDTVHLNYGDGIYFQAGANNYFNGGIVRKSTLKDNGSSGLKLNGYWNTWLVDGNQTSGDCLMYDTGAADNTFCGGIYLYTATGTDGSGTQVQNNVSHDNGITGEPGSFGMGIWADTTTGVDIHDNVSYNNTANGIYLEKTVSSKVYNNLTYNNGQTQFTSSLALAAGQGFNSTSNLVYNNTVIGGWWALALSFEDTNATMRNNTVEDNIVSPAVGFQALYVDATAANDTTHSSGNTVIYNNLGAPASAFTCYGGSCQSTYAALDTAVGSSTHSISGDPSFVAAGSANYNINAGSIARNSGITIKGAPQRTAELIPDLGAYEYAPGKLGTLSTSQLGNRYKSVTRQ